MSKQIIPDKMCILSVCMITYNQESFISEAIESVVHQKTEFKFELVISDDCSTDSTFSIIQSYQREYPELVRIIPQSENLGIIPNFLKTVSECKSKYIAFLDGDDYWIDNYKLQKQVDFLERFQNIAICFHPVKIKNEQTGAIEKLKTKKIRQLTTTKDILKRNYIQTCSVVFRNLSKGIFPSWIQSLSMGDWPVHILNSLHGDIYCLPETMGVYRVHGTSGWSKNLNSISGKKQITEKKLELFIELKNNFPAKWQSIIFAQINNYQKIIEIYSQLEKDKKASISTLIWLTWKSLRGHFESWACLKVLIKTFIPC